MAWLAPHLVGGMPVLLKALDGVLEHGDHEQILGALPGLLAEQCKILRRQHDVGFEQASLANQVVVTHVEVDVRSRGVFKKLKKEKFRRQPRPLARHLVRPAVGATVPARRASVRSADFSLFS